MTASVLGLVACGALCLAAAPSIDVGVARQDITPAHPIRLSGYGNRTEEATRAAARLWAKALAIGGDRGDGPAVVVTIENCGGPADLADEVAAGLAAAGVQRQRLLLCYTHTHTGPILQGFLPFLLIAELPDEQKHRIRQYRRELTEKLIAVAKAALAARRPARLEWAEGRLGFAMNRRPVKNGKCPGLGVNPDGMVDHSLPVMRAVDADGRSIALWINYACHCTTLTGKHNEFHGDWAGIAAERLEAKHAGTVAMVSVGCGADANPEPRGEMAMAVRHGEAAAAEVERLLGGAFRPLAPPTARQERIELPFDRLPTRAELRTRIEAGGQPKATTLDRLRARHAESLRDRLDKGEALPTTLPYLVTTWRFGPGLSMVFLPGEVVSGYALRLKKEVPGPLWINAYANDVPCYIVTRQILEEGGYEPDVSMLYYGRPTRFAPAIEDLIVGTVKRLLE